MKDYTAVGRVTPSAKRNLSDSKVFTQLLLLDGTEPGARLGVVRAESLFPLGAKAVTLRSDVIKKQNQKQKSISKQKSKQTKARVRWLAQKMG